MAHLSLNLRPSKLSSDPDFSPFPEPEEQPGNVCRLGLYLQAQPELPAVGVKVSDMLCLLGLTKKGSIIITSLTPADACCPVPDRAGLWTSVNAVGKLQWIYFAFCMFCPVGNVTLTLQAISYAEAEQVEEANLSLL